MDVYYAEVIVVSSGELESIAVMLLRHKKSMPLQSALNRSAYLWQRVLNHVF